MVAAPVALLAQGYTEIFLADIEADTLHGAFNIPVDGSSSNDINYGLNKYDLVVVVESSMISSHTLEKMAATFNCLNLRPVVIFAGDKCQQQPLPFNTPSISSFALLTPRTLRFWTAFGTPSPLNSRSTRCSKISFSALWDRCLMTTSGKLTTAMLTPP